MTDGNEFPTFPQSQLSREEIVNYLLEQKQRGYEVYQDPQLQNNLILVLNETHRINFIMGSVCQVQGVEYSSDVSFINVSTMQMGSNLDGLLPKPEFQIRSKILSQIL